MGSIYFQNRGRTLLKFSEFLTEVSLLVLECLGSTWNVDVEIKSDYKIVWDEILCIFNGTCLQQTHKMIKTISRNDAKMVSVKVSFILLNNTVMYNIYSQPICNTHRLFYHRLIIPIFLCINEVKVAAMIFLSLAASVTWGCEQSYIVITGASYREL